jgi:hypothetical protein
MNSPNTTQGEPFPWCLIQERINLLGLLLYKLLTVLNVAGSGGRAADQAACLLNDMREQSCQRAGAADPFPDMPPFPHFEDEESPATEVGNT